MTRSLTYRCACIFTRTRERKKAFRVRADGIGVDATERFTGKTCQASGADIARTSPWIQKQCDSDLVGGLSVSERSQRRRLGMVLCAAEIPGTDHHYRFAG